jgi:hypothetical protein
MKTLIREPLIHFLLLGLALFGVFAAFGKSAAPAPEKIVVPAGMIENLKVGFERNASRPPRPDELDNLIEDYVREEVLCREAVARGLDKDDPVIRQRLRKKMEFLTLDDANEAAASEEERKRTLDAAYQALRKNYVVDIQMPSEAPAPAAAAKP